MKPASPALTAHLQNDITTLAMCWRVKLTDNSLLGFTDHTTDLVIDSLTYHAATGFNPTAVETKTGYAVDNLDIVGILDSSGITETDIMAGRYDYAEVEIFLINYTDLSQGSIPLRKGWLGEVRLQGSQFVAEIRGLSQKLQQNIGELYSASCRAALGDTRCKVPLEDFTYHATVSSVISKQVFTASALTQRPGYFTSGEIHFTTGANHGCRTEVKAFSNTQVGLALPLPYGISVGDSFIIITGCDKTLYSCKHLFDNVVNFRGEPYVPGMDKMLETAATASFEQ